MLPFPIRSGGAALLAAAALAASPAAAQYIPYCQYPYYDAYYCRYYSQYYSQNGYPDYGYAPWYGWSYGPFAYDYWAPFGFDNDFRRGRVERFRPVDRHERRERRQFHAGAAHLAPPAAGARPHPGPVMSRGLSGGSSTPPARPGSHAGGVERR